MSTTSAGVNVLRYSALVLGIAYGMYHQRSLTTRHHSEKAERDYAHRESLIRRAKAEYTKKSLPDHLKQPAGGAGSGVITDPDDARFDLEAYLKMKEVEWS